MATAEYDGISLETPENVYEPREDSFLLADSVKRFARGKVLDVGTGSGIQAIAAARKKEVEKVVAADINPDAIECAVANAEKNNVLGKILFLESDLFHGLNPTWKKEFDAICFNPPYLPTGPGEHVAGAYDDALDGGKSGRETTDRFLAGFEEWLAPGGVLLLLQTSLSDKGETEKILRRKNYRVERVGENSFFFEKIFVLKAGKV